MTLGELARRCGGTLSGDPNSTFDGFAWDSRELRSGNAFLAIRGAQVDGHRFVPAARQAGASVAIVEEAVEGPHVLVPNLVEALARFGRSLRDEFAGPVVGITGSNGKTSAKEFTAAALSPLGPVVKTAGNQNTEFTSPLVWASAPVGARSAVIEMGMRGFGQIEHLASIARPTIAMITMIGTAHIEMVGSREGIAEAKAEIFHGEPGPEVVLLWQEDDFIGLLRAKAAPRRVLTFGFTPDADAQILGYRPLSWERSEVRVRLNGVTVSASLSTVGRHQALNAAAALLAASVAGVPVREAAAALEGATLPPMRMEIRSMSGATVVLDAYNASPDSTIAAIRTLTELPVAGRRLAVIGEMRELGSFAESGHRLVGRALAEAAIDEVMLVGELARHIEHEAIMTGLPPSRLLRAEGLADVRRFVARLAPGDALLIKGSRALGLEQALAEEVAG